MRNLQKNLHIIWQPPLLDTPAPPNLPYPPFLANILRLPFPSILKKLNPAPHLWRTGGSNYVLAFFLLSTQQIQKQIQKMQKLVQTFTTFNRTDASFFEKAIKYEKNFVPIFLYTVQSLKKVRVLIFSFTLCRFSLVATKFLHSYFNEIWFEKKLLPRCWFSSIVCPICKHTF